MAHLRVTLEYVGTPAVCRDTMSEVMSEGKREKRTVLIHVNVVVEVDADADDNAAIRAAFEDVLDDVYRHLEGADAEVVGSEPVTGSSPEGGSAGGSSPEGGSTIASSTLSCMCGAFPVVTHDIGDGLERCVACGCH